MLTCSKLYARFLNSAVLMIRLRTRFALSGVGMWMLFAPASYIFVGQHTKPEGKCETRSAMCNKRYVYLYSSRYVIFPMEQRGSFG